MLDNITQDADSSGRKTLRSLRKMYNDSGVLTYELAPIEVIETFADEETGQVAIEGVELDPDMRIETPEPEPEPEPEPQPEPEPRWQSPPRERSVSRGSTDSASSTDSFFSAQGEVP